MAEFLLPDVGEGLVEADIVGWHVKVGDTVAVNDVLCEIETAKSIVELPSPYAGAVEELLVEVGQTVRVGQPIIRIAVPGEDDAPATLVGYGPREARSRRGRRAAPAAAVAPTVAADAPVRPLATPPVRLRARELGIDLNQVRPSRADGVITMADLPAATDPMPALGDREYREPVKGVRKAMAQAMVQSAFTAPHVTLTVEIDTSHSVELIRRLRKEERYAGIKLTTLTSVARACILAMRSHPEINARWDGEAVTYRRYVNLGIAAATPRGLIVPNIKDAADLSGPELARAIEQLTAVARDGRAAPVDQAGGTFTITNIGVLKVDSGTPIINPGESAILALGAIRRKPWVIRTRDGGEAIAIRDVATFSLSVDHRFIDGAKASSFLAEISAYSEDPSGLGL